jgi:hypothetical protein
MRCRRICRELLWLTRFGELGPSSQPHLDHLAGCRQCRDEVGFDRAMVEQLRIALARRIEGASPSAATWERILARAQAPEPAPAARFFEWSAALVGRLRFATAMAGTGLALVLALNTQVIGLPTADTGADWERSTLQQVPRIAPEVSSLEQITSAWGAGASNASRPDPEAALTVVARAPLISSGSRSQPAAEEAPQPELRLVVRPLQTPEPHSRGSVSVIDAGGASVPLVTSQAGEPS